MLSFSVGRVVGLALALGMVPASAFADPAAARLSPDAAMVRVAAVDSAAPATLPGSGLDPMPSVDHPGLTAGPQPPASEPSALPETGPQSDTTSPDASQTPSAPESQTAPASSGAAEAPSDKTPPAEAQTPAVTPPVTEAPPAATPAPGSPAPDTSAPETSAPASSAPDSSAPASPAPASPSSVSPSPAMPDATRPSPAPDAAPQDPGGETDAPAQPAPPADSGADNGPLPEIHYGIEGLPEPVRKMRQAIIDAARTGDIEKLRPVFAMSKTPPELSKEPYKDPITYLKETSGDENGREILAILLDLLDAGWVHDGAGTPDEMYVWPYFSEIPVDRLTPPQEVELLRVLTASDVDEMRAYAAYLFYKIGIAPDGTWRFFMIADDGN